MCDPVTLALIATGVSAGTSVIGGMQQRKMANYQAEQAQADAEAEKGAAMVRADRIRELTRKRASAATAATAASGINVGSQTSQLITADIFKRGERDALIGLTEAEDAAGRLRAQAAGLRISGNQAAIQGVAQAGATVVSGYDQYSRTTGKGWYGSTGKK